MSSTPITRKPRKRRQVKINITRPIYTEKDFRKGYNSIDSSDISTVERLKNSIRKVEITPRTVWEFIKRLVPIIAWLPKYEFLDDGIPDMLVGVTVAIMRIPQELAYAILATLPAVYGLYTAFFPVIIYTILGTSRHISIGSQAVVSIMVGVAVDTLVAKESINTPTSIPLDDIRYAQPLTEQQLRIDIAISLCVLVGIIQTCMGIFRLGFVTIYLSEPLVNGFIAGASFQVLFGSQFNKMFGISVKQYTGPLSIIYEFEDFFHKLHETNPCTLIISLVSLVILVTISEINDRQAHKAWCRKDGTTGKRLPIPAELFVVVVAILSASLGNFESKYNLAVIGKISTGLPAPVLPHGKYFGSLLGNAVSISVVSFAISISMARMFATKHNYDLDANQELIAYGSCHIFGSFFQCFPQGTSMSRTAVQEGSGGRTQIVGVVSSLVVLATLLWLAPLLADLPECVLAVIIAVSLRGMFRNFAQLKTLWKVSFIDFLLFAVTFTLVVLLDVDLGLLFSVMFAFITVVVRTQSPYCALMGRVPDTDIYKDIADIEEAEELPGIRIFRCSSSPCFVNAEHFKSQLYDKVGVNPQQVLIAREAAKKKRKKMKIDEEPLLGDRSDEVTYTTSDQVIPIPLQAVIIECGMWNFVDVVGIKTLQNIASYYKRVGVHVGFSNCRGTVRRALLSSSELDESKQIGLGRMYLSVHDAVLNCIHKNPRTPYGSFIGESNAPTPRIKSPLMEVHSVLTSVVQELEENSEEFIQQPQQSEEQQQKSPLAPHSSLMSTSTTDAITIPQPSSSPVSLRRQGDSQMGYSVSFHPEAIDDDSIDLG